MNQRIGQSATDNSWINYPAATPSTVSYTANALNQYTAVGAVMPTYDGNGNLTFDGTFTFGYDARNRLTSASGAGNTVAYAYDAQGRRKTKTVNGTTTVFVTDADNREVMEYDGGSGAILRWYAYGLGSNDVLNQSNVTAGTRTALIPDIQGSIIATLDSGTATLTKAGYLPYGKSANAPSSFGYTAQRIDPETNGLYYYRTRHYSPLLGRFLQTDRSGTKGGVNLYAYARNDPLNLVDTTGKTADSPNSNASAAQNFNFVDTSDEEETVWNPMSASVGPLGNPSDPGSPASTFRSGTYTQTTLPEDQTLFRVASDTGNPTGNYWTSTQPLGPLQSVIDSALDQNWGNTATQVITATVPSGTTIYQGFAAAQGGLVGGGIQIYIPNVDPNWIQR